LISCLSSDGKEAAPAVFAGVAAFSGDCEQRLMMRAWFRKGVAARKRRLADKPINQPAAD